ncbi:VOC family protein [Bowmanella sp. JS7-9]|uniref:VOC family protein n=1 Tax=Pseudobowmanella zhangzhouensis TaxID=1537679 RepID=A0ABW1XKV4_9ALTE|nr:VOC family protein [Bowmanella sp. JS7-9]TBX20371.1 hypothetical protein TK45_15380 [Bowmanella sp. JS7-9]
MTQSLAAISLLVDDYDRAIEYYTSVLGFTLLEDIAMGAGKRWVKVAPGGAGCAFVLAKASNDRQRQTIGGQGGGRVWLFLQTDDFWADYQRYQQRGVSFLETPREEPYATVVVFEDIFGNRWDLLQPK